MSNGEKQFYEFGPFRLDPVKRRLLRAGEVVPLTPKAFDTLLALVERSGKTIEKDELMQAVWPDAVVEENNLNQNITALRKALGDSRQVSRYIATVPGLGYRFVAEVRRAPLAEVEASDREDRKLRLVVGGANEWGEGGPVAVAPHGGPVAAAAEQVIAFESGRPLSPPVPPSGESITAALKRQRKVAALVLVLVIMAAAGIAFWVYKRVRPEPIRTAASEIEVTPLTRTGTTVRAAISPDGRHVVYSVHEAGRESLWLRQVAASSAQQILPPAEGQYFAMTFSHDGNHIYFIRTEKNGSVNALYRMPALGGVPTRLLEDIYSVVTFSPDGSRMVFIRTSSEESSLIVADADGSNQHKLATRPLTDYFRAPAWSPDGKVIACSVGSADTYTTDMHNSIVAVRVEDGSQTPLTPQRWAATGSVAWLSDGSGLLITARERHEAPTQIWHIAYPGGAARRITSDSKMYIGLSLTADSKTLVAVQSELNSEIWVAPDGDATRARKLTSGKGSHENACYTPDGRIVYASQASGNWDIWIMNADGSGQKQLTADAGVNLHPAVSPDGRFIVFASNRAGLFNIWRMDSDGGNSVQLTHGGGEKTPVCSPDGQWVVYNTVASEQDYYALWKVPIEGGEPARLTDRYTGSPAFSPDGKRIAYIYGDELAGGKPKLALIPFTGGPPDMTFDLTPGVAPEPTLRWFPDGRSLTYTVVRDGIYNVWRQPLDGSEAKPITDFKTEGRFQFDWSRDGKQLILTRRLWPSDLVLLKNFAPKSF